MNPSQLYASAMGGIIMWLLVSQIIRVWAQRQHWPLGIVRLGRYLYRKFIFFLLRHLIYPQVFRTLTCNFIKTHSLPSIAARAGNLAVLNFVPLVFAGRLSLVSDLLGLPIPSYVGMHGTFGVMTCIQTALHATLTIRNQGWSPEHPAQFYGLLATFCLSIALLIIRGCLYEVFIKMHYILALTALVAVWRHIYMVVGSGILIGTTLLHWVVLLVRNVTLKQFGSRAQVHRGDGWA
ncbi:hypothetical protein GB937_008867 [Aspergillus fischeri]|nr:hypothetical protein GB937_008867 [Aspergillus fischeri]